ncbi:hypothetical protein HDU83_004507 [Entophlyctis luteolus]|nr:hypothetical protein HDU83_004507 [Entophlyctis luteolus]
MRVFRHDPVLYVRRPPAHDEAPDANLLPREFAEDCESPDEHPFRRISGPALKPFCFDMRPGCTEWIYCILLLGLKPDLSIYENLSISATFRGISAVSRLELFHRDFESKTFVEVQSVVLSKTTRLKPSATNEVALPFAIPVRTPSSGVPFSFKCDSCSIKYMIKLKFYIRSTAGLTTDFMIVPIIVPRPWASARPPNTPVLSAGDDGTRVVLDTRGRIQGHVSVLRSDRSGGDPLVASIQDFSNEDVAALATSIAAIASLREEVVVLRPKILSNLKTNQVGSEISDFPTGSNASDVERYLHASRQDDAAPEYSVLDQAGPNVTMFDQGFLSSGVASDLEPMSFTSLVQGYDGSSALNNPALLIERIHTPRTPPLPYSPIDPLVSPMDPHPGPPSPLQSEPEVLIVDEVGESQSNATTVPSGTSPTTQSPIMRQIGIFQTMFHRAPIGTVTSSPVSPGFRSGSPSPTANNEPPKYKIVMPRTMTGPSSKIPIDIVIKSLPYKHILKVVECILVAHVERTVDRTSHFVEEIELSRVDVHLNDIQNETVGDVGFNNRDDSEGDGGESIIRRRVWMIIPSEDRLGEFSLGFVAPLITLKHLVRFRMHTERARVFGGPSKEAFNLGAVSLVLMR